MFTDEQLIKMARSIGNDDINMRRHLVVSYVDDMLEDIKPIFYAELLRNEQDDICKWYEILALGKLKAVEFADLLIDIILKPDVILSESTSLHLISAGSLAKMGESVIELLTAILDNAEVYTRIAIMDTFGELRSEKALPYILPVFNEEYSKVVVFAGLAVSKIGIPSVKFITNIFEKVCYKNKVVLLEALMGIKSEDSYELIYDIMKQDAKLRTYVLSMQTKRVIEFTEYISDTDNNSEYIFKLREII